jgi:hypothetical protein
MKRAVIIAAVVVVALAYLAGYWPQRRQLADVRSQLLDTQTRLAAADLQNRLGDLLGRLLALSDAVADRNYGEAAARSSSFFDAVRTEASQAGRPEATTTLQNILSARDQVTTAIAGADPALPSVLKQQERELRRALGYPLSGG